MMLTKRRQTPQPAGAGGSPLANRNAPIPYLETAVADHEERGNQDDQRVLAVVRGADKTKALFPPTRLLKKP